MIAKKGTWVQIHSIILQPEERTGKIPEDTQKVPLEMWVKGYLNEDAQIGDDVSISTVTKRVQQGILVEICPTYNYGFGSTFVPELLEIDSQLRDILREEN